MQYLYDVCRVAARPFVRLHSSDDLTLQSKIAELLQVVQLCLHQAMPTVVACNAAAVSSIAYQLHDVAADSRHVDTLVKLLVVHTAV